MNDNILSTSADLLDLLRMDSLLHAAPTTAEATAPTTTEVTAPTTAEATAPTTTEATELADAAEDVNMDEYLARFEKIQSRNESDKQLISKLLEHKHAGGPLMSMVIDVVVNLHSQNEEMYSLLVDMNNLFGN